MRLIFECFITRFTGIRTFPAMCALVTSQMRRSIETLGTHMADILFFSNGFWLRLDYFLRLSLFSFCRFCLTLLSHSIFTIWNSFRSFLTRKTRNKHAKFKKLLRKEHALLADKLGTFVTAGPGKRIGFKMAAEKRENKECFYIFVLFF